MVVKEIISDVYSVGAIDWDRRLFDELIPLPDGTTYNSYLVKGSEKTVLIDTVDPTKEFDLVCNLVRLGVDRIDYIVANHAEQDHSGSLPMMLEPLSRCEGRHEREVQRILDRPPPDPRRPFPE